MPAAWPESQPQSALFYARSNPGNYRAPTRQRIADSRYETAELCSSGSLYQVSAAWTMQHAGHQITCSNRSVSRLA